MTPRQIHQDGKVDGNPEDFACRNCGHEQSKLRTIFECYWPKRDWGSKIGGAGIRAVLDCIAPGLRGKV